MRSLFPSAWLQFSGDEPPEFVADVRRSRDQSHPRRRAMERASRRRRARLPVCDCCSSTRGTAVWPAARVRVSRGSTSPLIVKERRVDRRRRSDAGERERLRGAAQSFRRGRAQRHRDRRPERSREDARLRARGAQAMNRPDARGYFGELRRPIRSRGAGRRARRAGARDDDGLRRRGILG